MAFQYGGSILDLCVLALVSREDLYGYRLTHMMKEALDTSESTLYPILRRLTKEKYLTTYDQPHDGRNRRYYTLTPAGEKRLKELTEEWNAHVTRVSEILERSES